MKAKLAVVTLIAALAVTGTAFARGGMGMGAGCGGGCPQFPQGTMTEQQKKFIADTLPLRDEMHAKHTALIKEAIKEKPDTATVTKLKGELQALRQKMQDARAKAGIPMMGGKRGGRGMHHGMGMMGGGCGPCSAQSVAPAPAK